MTTDDNIPKRAATEQMEASLRELEADPLFRYVPPDPDAPVSLTFIRVSRRAPSDEQAAN